MLLNKRNLEIIKIAGTDDARYALSSLYIDVEAKKTVATDGYRLVIVSLPEGVLDEDSPQVNGLTSSPLTKNCLLPKVGVEKLLKAIPKKTTLPILSHVVIDGAKTDADERNAHLAVTDLESPQTFTLRKKEGTFPNYQELFPKREPTVTICVNAKYLAEVLQLARDYGGQNCKVEIEIQGSDQPLLIRAQDRETGQFFEALLMPIRRKDLAPATAQNEKSEEAVPETEDQREIEDNPSQECDGQPLKQEAEKVEIEDEVGAPEEKEISQEESG